MSALPLAADVALALAEEIDPHAAWNGWKLGCLERAIFNARQEGREAALAEVAEIIHSSEAPIAKLVELVGRERLT